MSDNYVCTLDADGWQIYTSDKGSKAVAADLTGSLNTLVAKAKARLKAEPMLSKHKLAEQVRNKMYTHMERVVRFGAMDTEPQNVLIDELETAFGLDAYSLER
jgi:hypothetical protein